jgi:hypothetical protein
LPQGTGETPEEERATYIQMVVHNLEYAHAHYLFLVCDCGCPCYTPDHQLSFTQFNNNNLLPPELQVIVILHLSTKDFVSYTSTCSRLYALVKDPMYQSHYKHQWRKKKYIQYMASLNKCFTNITELLNDAIADIDLYTHPFHTCYNKGANSHHTHDLPKHKTFPSTSVARTAGALVKYNKGVGYLKENVLKGLSLMPNCLQKAGWAKLDAQWEKDKKRQQSDAYCKQTIENYKRKSKWAKHEKLVSKKRGDDYWAADKARAKTAGPQQRKVHTLPASCW